MNCICRLVKFLRNLERRISSNLLIQSRYQIPCQSGSIIARGVHFIRHQVMLLINAMRSRTLSKISLIKRLYLHQLDLISSQTHSLIMLLGKVQRINCLIEEESKTQEELLAMIQDIPSCNTLIWEELMIKEPPLPKPRIDIWNEQEKPTLSNQASPNSSPKESISFPEKPFPHKKSPPYSLDSLHKSPHS